VAISGAGLLSRRPSSSAEGVVTTFVWGLSRGVVVGEHSARYVVAKMLSRSESCGERTRATHCEVAATGMVLALARIPA